MGCSCAGGHSVLGERAMRIRSSGVGADKSEVVVKEKMGVILEKNDTVKVIFSSNAVIPSLNANICTRISSYA